jgi:hypothetical protein
VAAVLMAGVPLAASRWEAGSADPAGRAAAAPPGAESIAGWKAYVAAVEARRAAEAARPDGFLVLDFAGSGSGSGSRSGAADRRALMNGQVVIAQVDEADVGGETIDVRGAMVHHWRGAVFVPGITVEALVEALEAGPPPQADVLRSRVLARTPDAMTIYLRLRRTRIITVVYDTEHRVTFQRLAAGRAASTSVATRITEIDEPGTAEERAIPAGDDHGFLWRLNSYWRYQAVNGGVIAECESLTLSRSVPLGLGTIAGPIITSTARESMEAALRAVGAGL